MARFWLCYVAIAITTLLAALSEVFADVCGGGDSAESCAADPNPRRLLTLVIGAAVIAFFAFLGRDGQPRLESRIGRWWLCIVPLGLLVFFAIEILEARYSATPFVHARSDLGLQYAVVAACVAYATPFLAVWAKPGFRVFLDASAVMCVAWIAALAFSAIWHADAVDSRRSGSAAEPGSAALQRF